MNLVGLHDREATVFSPLDTWILDTIALSENPEGPAYNPGYHWICRCNWGYGSTGTIPLDRGKQINFLERLARYVSRSSGCRRWVIGNEPNLPREWPDNQAIHPAAYAQFFKQCRNVIRAQAGHEKDEVLIAAPGPWNDQYKYAGNEKGDWIKYFTDQIGLLNGEFDGFALHAYTHGYDPRLVTSTQPMDPPFTDRYYNFYTYRDYLRAIPDQFAGLPSYITEANGNGPWQATGLMEAMAGEINNHNTHSPDRKIKCLIFYRWPRYDGYYIEGKQDVMQEFKRTVAMNFKSPLFIPSVSNPTPPPDPNARQTVVRALLLNVRDKPGVNGSNIVGSRKAGDKIFILEEKNIDGNLWYRIGPDQWVSAFWTGEGPDVTPIPAQDNWQRTKDFTLGWEGGYQNFDWDSGNWTGCAPGKGENKGTNFGISACSYPNLDIRNITREQAHQIYFQDYWQRSGADKLPWPLCLLVFDTAVNHGVLAAVAWLKESEGDPLKFMALRLRGYRKSRAWPQAGNAWIDRSIDLMLEASE